MKYYLSFITIIIVGFLVSNKHNSIQANPNTPVAINWISLEEAEILMKEKPKKVYIDMYTSWCFWCKELDKKTLSNKNVINYLNENFYCIKYNAESKKEVTFLNKKYSYDAKNRANELSIELLDGQLSFPSSVFFEEGFKNPQAIPGYLDLKTMEMTLKYLAENKHKTTPWQKYQSVFKASWK